MLATRDDALEGKMGSHLGQRERRPVHRGEAARHGHASDLLGLRRHRPRPRRDDYEKLHFVMDLKNVRRGRIGRVRRALPGRPTPSTTRVGRLPAVGDAGRLRVPQRDAERDRRQGRHQPGEQRGDGGERGREHADRSRRRRGLPARGCCTGRGRPRSAGWRCQAWKCLRTRAPWPREEVDARLKDIMRGDAGSAARPPRSTAPRATT